ncbi:MAG: phosphopentomutase [Rhodospirillales bacterium]|nr:phosphopentomutase [Rhodospirillales bacterium]
MSLAFIIVIDSFGLGCAADAEKFGDVGANTLGHIAEHCALGKANIDGKRAGPLALPNLTRLGLGRAAKASAGTTPPGLEDQGEITGAYGFARETSLGKDTPSGHWEMAGLPVLFDWGYFPRTSPCFPADVISQLVERGNLPGILGDRHASGTQILEELGETHIRTGKPICYTSADSVFQIAAHEQHFGLDRLYDLCVLAKEILEPLAIGRVIARPFVGEAADSFTRTANRKDYTTLPHGPTLLDVAHAAGREVVSIGKIADIFADQGVSKKLKAADTDGLFDHTLAEVDGAADGSFIFTNLVDFDSVYGHRRNTAGYAAELEALDKRIPELEQKLHPDDLVVISADHGCDPTWPGTDHTRENIPVLLFGPGIPAINLGGRNSFADIGQTVAAHLGLPRLAYGSDCL